MKALDELSRAAGGDPLTAPDVRKQCEGGDQQACLAYGLLAVPRLRGRPATAARAGAALAAPAPRRRQVARTAAALPRCTVTMTCRAVQMEGQAGVKQDMQLAADLMRRTCNAG